MSQCAFFLFTIVDGIFVGRGVGTDALGAVNLAQPLVMVIGAVFMLTTIGGVTITAIRMGRNDGAPVFVMVSTIASTALNIFLDWLFVFPLKQALGHARQLYRKRRCLCGDHAAG